MVKKVSSIATLPEITAKIIATVEDPKSTPAHLHKIVAHDPALVTRILKVVNSAFYGLPGQIASIERAIVLLGLNAIKTSPSPHRSASFSAGSNSAKALPQKISGPTGASR